MMKSLQRILYVGLLVVTSAVMADTIALRDDHPNVYYVKKG
ncbi:MAG TPA: peptigoglycan-binding protein LysM, partial [Alcanivorax sp.]|nr:peptigoglycan-binding protein LysM [Alcanivorax sp.]